MVKNVRRLLSCAIATSMVLAPIASFALEPANNTAPWKNTGGGSFDTTVYASVGRSSWQGFEQIASSSDVDYIFFTCFNGLKMSQAQIDFTNSKGDLDVTAYDINGRVLGSSSGTTNTEVVNVQSFGLNVVILKVYGYNGATGVLLPPRLLPVSLPSYVKSAIAVALCATAVYLAVGRGAASGQADARPRGDTAPTDGSPGVGRQPLPNPNRPRENDETPADVVALRRALLAQAVSAPQPTPAEDPMAQARKTFDERMSSAPTNAREAARMEQMLRSVVDSGILGDTVATFTCGATMCKVDLMNSDNGRVETSTGALVEGVAKRFAATVIYPEGTGKRTMYLATNSQDLSLGPPPGPIDHTFTKTASEGKE